MGALGFSICLINPVQKRHCINLNYRLYFPLEEVLINVSLLILSWFINLVLCCMLWPSYHRRDIENHTELLRDRSLPWGIRVMGSNHLRLEESLETIPPVSEQACSPAGCWTGCLAFRPSFPYSVTPPLSRMFNPRSALSMLNPRQIKALLLYKAIQSHPCTWVFLFMGSRQSIKSSWKGWPCAIIKETWECQQSPSPLRVA